MIVVHRVIKPKYRRGGTLLGIKPKYQYGGHGVWLSGKKFVKDNIQNLINSVSKKVVNPNPGTLTFTSVKFFVVP